MTIESSFACNVCGKAMGNGLHVNPGTGIGWREKGMVAIAALESENHLCDKCVGQIVDMYRESNPGEFVPK